MSLPRNGGCGKTFFHRGPPRVRLVVVSLFAVLLWATAIFPQEDPALSNNEDLKNMNRYMEYVSWVSTQLSAIAAEAEKKGFKATSKELSKQEKSFVAMIPKIPVLLDALEKEVIARKYCRTLPGTDITGEELEKAYEKIKVDYAKDNIPDLEDAKPMLETKLLFEKKSVKTKLAELNKLAKKKENSETN